MDSKNRNMITICNTETVVNKLVLAFPLLNQSEWTKMFAAISVLLMTPPIMVIYLSV